MKNFPTYTPKKRTDQQRKSIEVFCELLAKNLNLAGLEMKIVLKPEYKIWWTKESVKENIFKPMCKAMFNKESTADLEKLGQIDKVHEQIMQMLGEKFGLEWIDWPHKKINEDNYKTEAQKLQINYPQK